jgi:hypothetical protein
VKKNNEDQEEDLNRAEKNKEEVLGRSKIVREEVLKKNQVEHKEVLLRDNTNQKKVLKNKLDHEEVLTKVEMGREDVLLQNSEDQNEVLAKKRGDRIATNQPADEAKVEMISTGRELKELQQTKKQLILQQLSAAREELDCVQPQDRKPGPAVTFGELALLKATVKAKEAELRGRLDELASMEVEYAAVRARGDATAELADAYAGCMEEIHRLVEEVGTLFDVAKTTLYHLP